MNRNEGPIYEEVPEKRRDPNDKLPNLPPQYEIIEDVNTCPRAETLKNAKVTLHNGNVKREVNLSCLKQLLNDSPLYSQSNLPSKKAADMSKYSVPNFKDPSSDEEDFYAFNKKISFVGGKKRKRKTVRKSKKSKSVRKHKKTDKKHAKRHSKTMKRKEKQHHKRSKKHHK